MKPSKREKRLIISDLHVPDQDYKTYKLVLKFIDFYKPDYLDLLGDLVNFTKISKYDQDPYYDTELSDEICDAREVVQELTERARKANSKVEIAYYEGNHEARMHKYLGKHAKQLADLVSDDEYIISVPHLLELKKRKIKWIPAHQIITWHGVSLFHGHSIRVKSGYGAHANIDKFGTSGFTGHSHKLAHVTKTQRGSTKFWIETGCLCNLTPTPHYALSPDWCQGFATAEYDPILRKVFPKLVPIVDHSFIYNDTLFK
jgi:hypothetical protein